MKRPNVRGTGLQIVPACGAVGNYTQTEIINCHGRVVYVDWQKTPWDRLRRTELSLWPTFIT